MNCLIINGHQESDGWGAVIREAVVAELATQGAPYRAHDLYAMRFQPALQESDFQAWATGEQPEAVRPLQADVTWADLLLLLYPIRWGGTPAMVKGYIDRVFAMGFAYGMREGKMGTFLTGKRALLFPSTADQAELELAAGLGPVLGGGALSFCGVEILGQRDLVGASDGALLEVRRAVQNALAAGS